MRAHAVLVDATQRAGTHGVAFDAQGAPSGAYFYRLATDTATITISDIPGVGGVKIETALGAKIEITAKGIEINNGMGGVIKLTGPQVSVNNGALEVV